MPRSTRTRPAASGWVPLPDPDGFYSSGIPDLDRLLGGGLGAGTLALFELDETVGREDLDLLLFPTFLNMLYHSRGIVAILPSSDSPREFRERLTRHVTRRRFDTRVRVCDYVGEDEGRPYVVNFNASHRMPGSPPPTKKETQQALAKAVAAEKAAQGGRERPYVEYTAFEIFDTLMGSERAAQLFFRGVKRAREMRNLVVGVLASGVGSAPSVRRMADTWFTLHRDEVGLIIRGLRPRFPAHVVTPDTRMGPPHVAFVPQPG